MTTATRAASAGSSEAARPTDRMLIAAAAMDAALREKGVVRGHDGGDGRYVTLVDSERLPGVVVAALRGGRYSVDLYLTAALVALDPLAEEIREAVGRSVEAIDLEDALGPVNVTFLAIEEQSAP